MWWKWSSASDSCKSCGGTGYDEVKDSFKVDIPEGVNDGMRIRVSNKRKYCT